jgi:hypothetical protein
MKETLFIADKIIVLDSLDIHLSKLGVKTQYGIIPPLHDAVSYDNCILLCNPSNVGSCDFETHIYFHKFSYRRLLNLKHKKKILKKVDSLYYYEFNRVLRHEHYKDHSSVVHENIGKLIFECIFYGLKVNYSAEGYVSDGLSCYLELFEIDPSINHYPLPISIESIEDKLFMKEDDLILRLINEN